jgi:hypothetical protein
VAKDEKEKTAAPLIPSRPTLAKLKTVAAGCQACDLVTS